MTDGENTAGLSKAEFFARYASLPEDVKQTKTFTVLFGEADRETMEEIATATGGRSFDGRKKSLSEIFKTIRGYHEQEEAVPRKVLLFLYGTPNIVGSLLGLLGLGLFFGGVIKQ